MEINPWTRYVQRGSYTGVISGVREAQDSAAGKPAPDTDTVTLSEEARQAAMAAEMEKDGFSHEAAKKLASGKLTVNEPDWDTFQLSSLEVQADPGIYRDAYFKALAENLNEMRQEVEAYYAPESARLQGMDDSEAMDYLFKTYMMPYMEDVFVPGTPLPAAPGGMSREEARMAYDQLKGLRFGNGVVLGDRYALGEAGMKKLASVEERARQTAQEARDAAQREADARQEVFKAQRKERFQQTIARINSGTGTCMGYLSLRKNETGAEEAAE